VIKLLAALLALPLALYGGRLGGPLQQTPEGSQVTGNIINGTEGREVPEGLEVMLHSWSEVSGEGPMGHGASGPGGAFAFDGLQIVPGATYAAMALYEGAAYFSQPVVASELEPLPPFEIVIYETTQDLAAVSVDSLHVIFQAAQGGLGVTEIYVLSNRGDYTVSSAAEPGAVQDGSLRFWLPEGAATVGFPGSEGNRFVLTAEGFRDTAPLVPGEGSGQVAVSYVLAYKDGLRFHHDLDLPVPVANILLPSGSGLEVGGGSAEYAGARAVGNAGVYEVYRLAPLAPGEEVDIELSGTLALPAAPGDAALPESPLADRSLPLGLAALGTALLGAGVWWWGRISSEAREEEPLPESLGTGEGG
jgi:hypothetical protein